MRKVLFGALLICFGCVRPVRAQSVTSPSPQTSAPLVADDLGRASLPIDGPWQFHPGDDLAWASPQFDDSQWQTIQTGRPWEGQGHPSLTGFGWYRRHVTLPRGPTPDWKLGVLLAGVQDAAEVYWNGHLVGSYGKVPPDPIWFVWYDSAFPVLVVLGPASDQPMDNVLAVRVWKAPYVAYSLRDMGGLTQTPLLGSARALAAIRSTSEFAWLRTHQYDFSVVLISAVVSLLALLAWLRDRRQWLFFWVAAYTARPVAFLSFGLPWQSWSVRYGTVGLITSATDAALWFLLLYLLDLRNNRRLVRWTVICASIAVGCQVLDASEQLFDWTQAPRFFLIADVGLTIPSVLLSLWPIVLIAFAVRKHLDAARWMVASFALLADVIPNLGNILLLGARWTGWTFIYKIWTPLFTIAGNPFNLLNITNTLLLFSIVYAVWRYEQERGRRQIRLDEEFRNAQELQQVLIPESLPEIPGLAVASAYRPAQEVGGDFFQVIALEAGSALVVIGDVSGKGLKAAMAVSFIVGALRSLIETITDPAELLASLNRRLYGRLRGGFVTCLVMRLGAEGGGAIANAGHLAPYRNGVEVPLDSGLPLGIVADAEYSETTLRLEPGDTLTLLSDGVVEATNVTGELLGFERTAALSTQSAQEIAEAARAFGQQDDITVVTLTRLAAGEESRTEVVTPLLAPA
jgi:hypothetical protein